MENSQNDISQIKNLLGEVNNHIIQINDRITQINNIITQINNIMINNKQKFNQKNLENQKIDNFMQMMRNFKINMKEENNNYDLSTGKNKEQKLSNEEFLEKEAIETVMSEGKCSREDAVKALLKHNGDPVEALLELDNRDNSIKSEEKLSNEEFLEKEAIETVMKEAKCSREDAIKALLKHNGDPVCALLEIGQ